MEEVGLGACLSLSQSWAHLARAGYCRILEERDQPGGSALFPGHEGVMMLLASGYTQGLPPARRKYWQHWRLEALLRRLQGAQRARCLAATWQCWADARGVEQLAHTLEGRGCRGVQVPEAAVGQVRSLLITCPRSSGSGT